MALNDFRPGSHLDCFLTAACSSSSVRRQQQCVGSAITHCWSCIPVHTARTSVCCLLFPKQEVQAKFLPNHLCCTSGRKDSSQTSSCVFKHAFLFFSFLCSKVWTHTTVGVCTLKHSQTLPLTVFLHRVLLSQWRGFDLTDDVTGLIFFFYTLGVVKEEHFKWKDAFLNSPRITCDSVGLQGETGYYTDNRKE